MAGCRAESQGDGVGEALGVGEPCSGTSLRGWNGGPAADAACCGSPASYAETAVAAVPRKDAVTPFWLSSTPLLRPSGTGPACPDPQRPARRASRPRSALRQGPGAVRQVVGPVRCRRTSRTSAYKVLRKITAPAAIQRADAAERCPRTAPTSNNMSARTPQAEVGASMRLVTTQDHFDVRQVAQHERSPDRRETVIAERHHTDMLRALGNWGVRAYSVRPAALCAVRRLIPLRDTRCPASRDARIVFVCPCLPVCHGVSEK